ncbi:MAG: UbiD family decarboxylase [SAR324 cluster bacterium]|nr:UbiD family decarboxylase [SAR324 cluster bacterium]
MAKMKPLRSTRDFVERLQAHGELLVIDQEVNPYLELAEIQREVCRRKGPALLFTNVSGTPFSVATNLYGSTGRIELAFGGEPAKFVKNAAHLAQNLMPINKSKMAKIADLGLKGLKIGLKRKKSGPIFDNCFDPVDLSQIPQLHSWPEDGGAFVTLPLVYTESPSTGKGNLGMYRIQLFNQNTTGMHIQIHRGGGYHHHEAELKSQALPARVIIGGPPALTIAAVAPLPEDMPEFVFASLLMGEKLKVGTDELGIDIPLDADFCISGSIPAHKRKPEGPFGDHYGYYSLQHDYPYLEVSKLNFRKGAIYPATVVGRPPQEDHYIAEYLQEILEPMFPLVMPNVRQIWAFEESGVHSLAGAVVKNRYPKEAFTAAIRILSEGQLSLTKFLIATDQDIQAKDFKSLITTVLERADLERDLFVLSNISQDTLDYTGPKVNEGSKAILLGLGEKKRDLYDKECESLQNTNLSKTKLFCRGVLLVQGCKYEMQPALAEELAKENAVQNYAMVCMVDDVNEAAKSAEDFIWHVFTRFEPAGDMYGNKVHERFHTGIKGPLVIDCRMKPTYPRELTEDPDVTKLVQEKFGTIFDKM